jgi:hypothetical protein
MAATSGFHGGSRLSAILLSAPASIASGLVFGDTALYIVGLIVGTGVWYAAAVWCYMGQKSSAYIFLSVHTLCGVILSILRFV